MLIGRNGSGTTALVRILSTELMRKSGGPSINGVDVVRDADTFREKIAIVHQEARYSIDDSEADRANLSHNRSQVRCKDKLDGAKSKR